jgi:hypothetical protein
MNKTSIIADVAFVLQQDILYFCHWRLQGQVVVEWMEWMTEVHHGNETKIHVQHHERMVVDKGLAWACIATQMDRGLVQHYPMEQVGNAQEDNVCPHPHHHHPPHHCLPTTKTKSQPTLLPLPDPEIPCTACHVPDWPFE